MFKRISASNDGNYLISWTGHVLLRTVVIQWTLCSFALHPLFTGYFILQVFDTNLSTFQISPNTPNPPIPLLFLVQLPSLQLSLFMSWFRRLILRWWSLIEIWSHMEVRMYTTEHGNRDGAVVSSLASHQCGPGSNAARCHVWFAWLQGLSFGLSSFQPPQKSTLQIAIRPGWRTNMESSLGGIGFIPKYCNLFHYFIHFTIWETFKASESILDHFRDSEESPCSTFLKKSSHSTRSRSLLTKQTWSLNN